MNARLNFSDGSAPSSHSAAAGKVDRRAVLDDAKAVMPCAAIAAFTGLFSMVVVWLAQLAKEPMRLLYVGGAITVLQLVMLAWATIELWRSAQSRALSPLRLLAVQLRYRLLLLALPTLILPLFLASYTINKTGIAFLIGFRWDSTWANVDAAIFGEDAWRITHALIGPIGTRFLEFCYAIVWGMAFAFVAPLIALYGSTRLVGRFYLAIMLSWLIGGNMLAYLLASAGPFLAPHVDPALALRFAPLNASLQQILAPTSLVRGTQEYLIASIHRPFVITGGGISAMPSMHIATVTLYALAARGTRWFAPALVFAAAIAIGSVHLGFHYVCDGVVGAAIGWLCWVAAGRWFDRYRDWPPAPVRAEPASFSGAPCVSGATVC